MHAFLNQTLILIFFISNLFKQNTTVNRRELNSNRKISHAVEIQVQQRQKSMFQIQQDITKK